MLEDNTNDHKKLGSFHWMSNNADDWSALFIDLPDNYLAKTTSQLANMLAPV